MTWPCSSWRLLLIFYIPFDPTPIQPAAISDRL